MSDHWTDRLSAYLDGELASDDRSALERHLEGCPSCRSDLERLKRVTHWAATYEGTAPSAVVWRQIRDEIRTRQERPVTDLASRRRSRIGTRLPLAVAASLAFVMIGAGGWIVGRVTAPAGAVVAEGPARSTAAAMIVAARQTDAALLAAERYGAAIAQLEQALLQNGGRLDSATVRVVVQKLAVIDRAIAEARAAMAADPESAYLAEHFATMMRKKLNLLRSASAVQRS